MPQPFWPLLVGVPVIGFLYWLEWEYCPMPDEEAWCARTTSSATGTRANRGAAGGRGPACL